jgi:hypothetical protein
MVPKGETKKGWGSFMLNDRKCEVLWEKNMVQLNVKVGILKCTGKIKKCEVYTMSDLVGKVKRRAMKPQTYLHTYSMEQSPF